MEQFQKLMKNRSNLSYKTHRTYRSYRTYWTYVFLLALFFSFFPQPVPTAHAGILSRPPTNLGLVGYWPMDEGTGNKVIDASGQGNIGTITGASWTNGKHGGALNFNGSSNSVKSENVNFITALNQAWSGSAWIYPTSTSVAQAVWSYGEFNDTANSTGFGIGANGNLFWFLNGVSAGIDSGLSVPLNSWSFVSIVRNPTTINFYINGLTSTVGSVLSNSIGIGNPHQIGYSSKNRIPEGYFSGKIDDVRIYNRALTAAEISKLNSSGAVRTKSGPSLVQAGTCLISGNTCTINITNNAGNLLWVGINDYSVIGNGYVYSVSDTKGNSYITASPATDTGNVNAPQIIQTFYAANVPAGANTITCSRGAHNGGSGRCVVLEYSGIATVSPFDGHQESAVSGTNYTSGNLSTSNRNDLLIGYFASRLPQTWSNLSLTSRFQNNIDFGVLVQDKLVSAIGTYSATAIASDSAAGVGAINAFKSATGSTKISSTQNNKLTNGLVGLWSFNGTDINWASNIAYDRSGLGNNGTMASTTPAVGKVGQALNFNGTTSYINSSLVANDIATGSVTVSAWVKLPVNHTSVSAIKTFFSLQDSPSSNDIALCFSGSGSSVCNGAGSTAGSICLMAYNTIHNFACTSTRSWSANIWYHVVGQIDTSGGGMKLFINGVQNGSNANTTRGAAQSTHSYIGGEINGSSAIVDKFPGVIDEVRVYNRALSSDEVKQLYNMGK